MAAKLCDLCGKEADPELEVCLGSLLLGCWPLSQQQQQQPLTHALPARLSVACKPAGLLECRLYRPARGGSVSREVHTEVHE